MSKTKPLWTLSVGRWTLDVPFPFLQTIDANTQHPTSNVRRPTVRLTIGPLSRAVSEIFWPVRRRKVVRGFSRYRASEPAKAGDYVARAPSARLLRMLNRSKTSGCERFEFLTA